MNNDLVDLNQIQSMLKPHYEVSVATLRRWMTNKNINNFPAPVKTEAETNIHGAWNKHWWEREKILEWITSFIST